MKHVCFVALSTILLLFSTCAAFGQNYRMTNLGSLGGHVTSPEALNDLGHVVGFSTLPSGQRHGFFWSKATRMLDLAPSLTGSEGSGINNSDQVAGSESANNHAFRWTASTGIQDLGTLGGAWSSATGINDLGEIVGNSAMTSGVVEGFVWTQTGGMQAVSDGNGTYLDGTIVSAVNQRGAFVGSGTTTDFVKHALLWTPKGSIVDLGNLGGQFSYGEGIDGLNQVVGTSYDAQNQGHAYFWTDLGGLQELPTPSGFNNCVARSVNKSGLIVGTCWSLTLRLLPHAFLWSNGGVQDLNSLVIGTPIATLAEAVAINRQGQIVVLATSSPRRTASWALLLTPQ